MKKIPNHPGIYCRTSKDGRKTYYLRLKENGRQTWRAVGPKLLDAKKLWYQIKAKKASDRLGIFLPQRILFSELAADYLKYYQTKARESNWPRVGSVFKSLEAFFGRMELKQITSWSVEHYIRDRGRSGRLSPSTINQELIYMAAAMNKAVEWGLIEKAPVIKTLPVQESRARILSDGELDYILANVSEKHRDAILIALDTGMRLREIFWLSPGNVNFEAGEIYVEDTKSRKHRSIPMTPRVAEILERRFATPGGRLFPEKNDIYLSRNFHYERKRLKEISPWRFHDLRHTFCTRLLQKGVDPFTVMKLSGHSKLEMVTRYLHTDDELKRAAIQKLGPSD